MSTYSVKPSDIQRKWLVIDASDLVLGRLAAEISRLLRGKHKAIYSPHIDCGDNVIVINAEKIKLTGKKYQNKKYFWHTGFPGGIKEINPRKIIEGKYPERVIEKAVQRMLSRDALGRAQMTKLKVYAGTEHPHQGQNPEAYDFGAKNRKNKVGK